VVVTREEELARVRPRLLGLAAEERIARVDISRPDPEVVAGFLALTDLTSTALDALDELGVGGGIGASELAPRSAGRICGPAITIRYTGEGGSVGAIKDRGGAQARSLVRGGPKAPLPASAAISSAS
jgi:hypothetical protein